MKNNIMKRIVSIAILLFMVIGFIQPSFAFADEIDQTPSVEETQEKTDMDSGISVTRVAAADETSDDAAEKQEAAPAETPEEENGKTSEENSTGVKDPEEDADVKGVDEDASGKADQPALLAETDAPEIVTGLRDDGTFMTAKEGSYFEFTPSYSGWYYIQTAVTPAISSEAYQTGIRVNNAAGEAMAPYSYGGIGYNGACMVNLTGGVAYRIQPYYTNSEHKGEDITVSLNGSALREGEDTTILFGNPMYLVFTFTPTNSGDYYVSIVSDSGRGLKCGVGSSSTSGSSAAFKTNISAGNAVNCVVAPYSVKSDFDGFERVTISVVGKKTVAVDFDANGGLSAGYSVNHQNRQALTTFSSLPSAARDGYVFDGWFSEKEGGEKITTSSIVPKTDVTYYAHWRGPVISFNSNGGTDVDPISYDTVESDAVLGSLPVPEREGYDFDGWFSEKEGGEKVDENTARPTADTTYYAHWTGKTYTITFDSNGGKAVDPIEATYGKTLGTLPTPEMEDGSAYFDGWFTEKEGGEAVTSSTSTPLDGATYYAHWTNRGAVLYEDGTLIFQEDVSEVKEGHGAQVKTYSGFESSGSHPWLSDKDSILVVDFDTEVKMTNPGGFFANMSNLTEVKNLDKLNITGATSTSAMFLGCSSLKSVDISGLDTSSVTSMAQMFQGCSSLESLNYTGINTSKVTSMFNMFNGAGLKSFSFADIDISNVTDMSNMFYNSALENVYFGSSDTSKLSNVSAMFYGSSLKALDMSGLDLSSLSRADGFVANTSPSSISFSGSTLGNVSLKNLTEANDCGYSVNFYSADLSKVTNVNLSQVPISSINFRSAKFGPVSMESMFGYDSRLKYVDFTNADLSQVTSMKNMFTQASSLSDISFKNCDLGTVESLDSMFAACNALKSADFSGANLSSVISAQGMFASCSSLKAANFKGADMSSVVNVIGMFGADSALETVDFSDVTFGAVDMSSMFGSCKSLSSANFQGSDFSKATDMSRMFGGCSSLPSFSMSSLSMPNLKATVAMFGGCSSMTSIDLSGLETPKLEDAASMFGGCSSLTDVSIDWAAEKLTSTANMFASCSALKSLDLSGLTTLADITTTSSMFADCTELQSLDISGLTTTSSTDMATMFKGDSKLEKLVLGENFAFSSDTDSLPFSNWLRVETDTMVDDLWHNYDGATMSGTYIQAYTEVIADQLVYDPDTNHIDAIIVSAADKAPVPVSANTLYPTISISAAQIKTDPALEKVIQDAYKNGTYEDLDLTLSVKTRTYADIMACSNETPAAKKGDNSKGKVIWTFDVPKDNTEVIRIDVSGPFNGYIINTKDDLETFTLYSEGGTAIAVLSPGNRHTYADLGYTGSYTVGEGETAKTYNSTDYSNLGSMYDEKPSSSKDHYLGEEIYPEYSNYISYNPKMNNYEVAMTPGKYIIDVSCAYYDDVKLTPVPDEDYGKASPEGEEEEEITYPDKYNFQTDVEKSDAGKTADLSLFNFIKKESVTEIQFPYRVIEVLFKVDQNNNSVSGATFKLTSKKSGTVYYAKTNPVYDSFAHRTYYGAIAYCSVFYSDPGCTTTITPSFGWGETFIAEEIASPSGYYIATGYTEVTFLVECGDYKQTAVGYNHYYDGVSITAKEMSDTVCKTCMGNSGHDCLCGDFGKCSCTNCGVSLYIDNNDVKRVEIVNRLIPSISFFKRDKNNRDLLGATIQLIDKETGAVLRTEKMQSSSVWYFRLTAEELPYGTTKTFILHESEAPEGYDLAEDIEVTVSWNDYGQSKYMYDDKFASVQLTKYNSDKTKKLGGAEFDIYKVVEGEEDSLFKHIVIGEDGVSDVIEGFAAGKYYFVETKAPEGYTLNPEKTEFEITKTQYNATVQLSASDETVAVLPTTGGNGTQTPWMWMFLVTVLFGTAAVVTTKKYEGQ